jgi:hypothetical protein
MPDYDDVIADASDMHISEVMHNAIREWARGPEIAYHLATHREEAARIAKLAPYPAAEALAEIKAALPALPSKEVPAKAAAAKPLPKPAAAIGGSHAPTQIDLDKADMRTFKREFGKLLANR